MSVGNLVELKGNHLTIEALSKLPDTHLALVGSGPEEARLRRLADEVGVSDRVHFLGLVKQEDLRWYYSAGDALVLVSSREGWPNVLLEAMACGMPVIANNVGGTPEIVTSPAAGVLLDARDADDIARKATQLFDNYPTREHTREYAAGFSWDQTSDGQYHLFSSLVTANAASES